MSKFNYLQRYRPMLKEISEEHEISEREVEHIVDHFFQTFRESIMDPRMPKIQITKFGTFRPTIGAINRHLRLSFYNFHHGRISRERMVERIKRVWPIKQRLLKEKNGEATWKEWRDKEFENAKK